MFFQISKSEQQIAAPFLVTMKIDQFFILLDKGWHQHGNFLYKGYCLEQSLHQKIMSKDLREQTGNYVIIKLGNGCSIHYDNSRSFPMFYDHETVTNYEASHLTAVWFDGSVYFQDNGWHFKHRPENVVRYNEHARRLNKQTLVDLYCDYLVDCCERLQTDLPIFCADSKGVDSLTVMSALDYCGKQYTRVKAMTCTKGDLGWGYMQLFETSTPHLQATGFCGDELLLRNPLYCQWLLDSSGIDLAEEFDKTDHSYMKGFFNSRYRKKIKKHVDKFSELKQGIEHTANVALNDFQMWHTDHTLTFTPYRNTEMAVRCLYADCETILDQVIHAGVSKEIIRRLNPYNLESLSSHKNHVE